jgi:hypothetical protein
MCANAHTKNHAGMLPRRGGRAATRRRASQAYAAPMTDAELWQLTSDARLRAEAAEREANAEPSVEAQERWLRIKAEYERLARQWQRRIGGVA